MRRLLFIGAIGSAIAYLLRKNKRRRRALMSNPIEPQSDPELIGDLEERTRKVQGVSEDEDLLHVPGTPAPTK